MSGLAVRGCLAGFILMMAAFASRAESFSTSITSPVPLPGSGVVAGQYPPGGAEVSYYFSVDLTAGELLSQIYLEGRPGPDKKLELDLLGPNGRRISGHYLLSSLDANDLGTRVLPVDQSGRHVIRILLRGPETTRFSVELGGSAVPGQRAATTTAGGASKSFLAPSPVPPNGVISGAFPGGERKNAFYFFEANLKPGDLLSQISFAGRSGPDKQLTLDLLAPDGRVASSYYILSGLDAKKEATKTFSVDRSDRHVLRVSARGPETTTFKIELGGDAFTVGQ
jgi:hypothetical protein